MTFLTVRHDFTIKIFTPGLDITLYVIGPRFQKHRPAEIMLA